VLEAKPVTSGDIGEENYEPDQSVSFGKKRLNA
jgi:hypothetical protein